MDSMTPLVSVIIPAYNAERYIKETIQSVQNQTFHSWEIIVIDDCSQDATCFVITQIMANDARIQLVKNVVNLGAAASRNKGVSLAKGKYIAFLDADDVWFPEKLEKTLVRLQEENADFAYSSYAIVDAKGEKVKPDYIVPKTTSFVSMLKENVIGCSTVVISRNLADKYRFVENFYHEDYVLWLQLLKEEYKAVGVPEVLVGWRFLENARSFNKRNAAINRWKIYHSFLKLPIYKSVYYFLIYATMGFKKYGKAV